MTSTPPPQLPGPGLEWVEVNDRLIEADIERSLAELALSVMRDADQGLRLSAASDWVKIEAQVRTACQKRWSRAQARAAAEGGQLQ